MPTPTIPRRLILLALVLPGCGFALRQAPPLPFQTLHLSGFAPESTMASALRRHLATTATKIVDTAVQAQATLQAQIDRKQRTALLGTTGQVQEIQLQTLLRFTVTTPEGQVLLPPTDISLTRDLTYNEHKALAKEQEENASYSAMQDDIAMQVLRRLSTLHL